MYVGYKAVTAIGGLVKNWFSRGDVGGMSKPNQLHHFLTDKNKVFTPQFQRIANKYNLSLVIKNSI